MIQTSTPMTNQRKSLRRSVLLKDVNNTSMSLRRLSNVAAQQTPINQLVLDDDLERSQRRSEADLHKRMSNIGAQTPTQFNEKEVRDHFHICLKMFAENKICAKNAWNLKIIDYMLPVIKLKGKEKDSLQVAGTSLDVSTKVYGIRVDDIHSDGLKLASNMARVKPQNDDTNDDDQDEDDPANTTKAKAPKKKKPKITVVKDPKSLVSDIPKMESVFFQTRTDLEASSTDNLFTNKLTIHPLGFKFMLLNKECTWNSHGNSFDGNFDKKFPLEISKLNKMQICPQFSNFEIDEWDPSNEKEMLNIDRTVNDEVVFDSDGIPIAELDGSLHDVFANNAEPDNDCTTDEEEVNGIGQIALQNRTAVHVVSFQPNENGFCTDDYNYSNLIKSMGNKHITQVWAGPSHWKLKYIKPVVANLSVAENYNKSLASRFSGQADKQTVKSVRKPKLQPTLIDFFNEESNLNKKKFYKTKRKTADDNPYKCTLPQVLLNTSIKNSSLMLKPLYLVKASESKMDTGIDKEMAPYNYENPDDSQYCVENGLGDDNHSGDEDFGPEEAPIGFQQNFNENLIDVPQLVPNTYIPYAMQAKKMDMKKLKASIWKGLISKTPSEAVPEQDMYTKEVQPTKFSSMYKHLPERLSEKMQTELSCPLAFVALLHLANEQNLEFQADSDLLDFSIKQVKQFVR